MRINQVIVRQDSLASFKKISMQLGKFDHRSENQGKGCPQVVKKEIVCYGHLSKQNTFPKTLNLNTLDFFLQKNILVNFPQGPRTLNNTEGIEDHSILFFHGLIFSLGIVGPFLLSTLMSNPTNWDLEFDIPTYTIVHQLHL